MALKFRRPHYIPRKTVIEKMQENKLGSGTIIPCSHDAEEARCII